MSDNIEYNGSWAQPVKNQEVIASDSTGAEAVAISNAILVPTFCVGIHTSALKNKHFSLSSPSPSFESILRVFL